MCAIARGGIDHRMVSGQVLTHVDHGYNLGHRNGFRPRTDQPVGEHPAGPSAGVDPIRHARINGGDHELELPVGVRMGLEVIDRRRAPTRESPVSNWWSVCAAQFQ